MRIATTFFFSLTGAFSLWAQLPSYRPAESIPFFQEGRRLAYALAGGLEAPQFANIHLNADGLTDLLVFDRVGAKALPFVAVSTTEGILYGYAPAYESALPPLNQMAKITDLNCDGLADLLTTEELSSAADVALKVYLRQPTSDGSLDFQARRLQLYNSLNDTLIRIHAFDLPAVADINGDELPDLLYIPQGGTQLQYYENISMEVGGCDSLAFELRDDCWGEATYTLDGTFELHSCDPGRFSNPSGCAGSAMLLLDDDEDGDQDLLFSGIYDYHIQLLANGGDNQTAQLTQSTTDWLFGGEPLTEFPAPYIVSLEEDGAPRLIVATNRINGAGFSPFGNDIYLFRRDNGDGSWNLQSSRFLAKDMIDHGFRSSPAIWDVNEDGLPDLLIAYNSAHPIYGYTSGIALYLNTGSAGQPEFTLATEDFGMLSIYNLKAIHPAVGDLTGDGIPELVLGLENGSMQVYTNSQSALSNYFPMSPNPLSGVSLYGYARPQLIDVDENGTLDLLCGARNGTMALIENSGTPSSPQFTLVEDTLGAVAPQGYFQECSPFFLKQEDGSYLIFYGQRDGTISVYEGRLDAPFALITSGFSGIDVGERATLALHDLNADGVPEIIAGNMRGGVEAFEAGQVTSTSEPATGQLTARAIPNPARGSVSFEWEGHSGPATLLLFDVTGRLVFHEKTETGRPANLAGLPAGLYFFRIRSGNREGGGKLMLIK
ncbi:MAG: T9SS type A sorting domain-containing protein [Lewinellaceae bacterium]|nr:T9SS type A sorting domain-containing protein [Lewinellaceae bacterium]